MPTYLVEWDRSSERREGDGGVMTGCGQYHLSLIYDEVGVLFFGIKCCP